MRLNMKVTSILWTKDNKRVVADVDYDATVIILKDGDSSRVFHYAYGAKCGDNNPVFVEGKLVTIEDSNVLAQLKD